MIFEMTDSVTYRSAPVGLVSFPVPFYFHLATSLVCHDYFSMDFKVAKTSILENNHIISNHEKPLSRQSWRLKCKLADWLREVTCKIWRQNYETHILFNETFGREILCPEKAQNMKKIMLSTAVKQTHDFYHLAQSIILICYFQNEGPSQEKWRHWRGFPWFLLRNCTTFITSTFNRFNNVVRGD